MKSYLERLSFGNARTEDLWEYLGEASGKPVARVMATWTEQMGFPVLTADFKENGTVSVTQAPFYAGGRKDHHKDSRRWEVPISVTCKSSPEKPLLSHLLKEESDSLELKGVGQGEWVNLNPRGIGFYRVVYPKV